MMKPLLPLFVWLLSLNSFCQERPFAAIAEDINAMVFYHDQLYPFREMVSLKDFNLDYETIKNELGDEVIYSAGKDSAEVWPLREYYQARIFRQLDELFGHKDFSKHDVAGLLNVQVIKSDDNRLYNVTWDENTGGTYRSRLSASYYFDKNSKLVKIEGESLHPDGYNTIHTVKTRQGTKYLLLGSVVGCGTCLGEYIILISFEGGKPVTDFRYDCAIRMDDFYTGESCIEYNEKEKTITVHFITSDLTNFCNCSENPEETDGSPHECTCVFKFNGDTFELASGESRKVKH